MPWHESPTFLPRALARRAKTVLRLIFFSAAPAFALLAIPLASLLNVAELRAQNPSPQNQAEKLESVWRVQEFMVPMRDGIRLQTVVIARRDQAKPCRFC